MPVSIIAFLCTTITLVVIYGIAYLCRGKNYKSRPGVAFCLGVGLTILYTLLLLSLGVGI